MKKVRVRSILSKSIIFNEKEKKIENYHQLSGQLINLKYLSYSLDYLLLKRLTDSVRFF